MAVPCYRHVLFGPLRAARPGVGRIGTTPLTVRRSVLLVCLAALTACSAPTPTSAPEPTSSFDETGILLVDPEEQVQAGPVTEDMSDALVTALMLAESNGGDVGYPWIDPETGELVLSAATPRGRELIEAAGISVPHRIRDVAYGAAELERIQHDATTLRSQGVAGAELIFMTGPDHRDNRTLIVISEMSRPLLDHLAASYPVDAIAVQVDPDLMGGGAA
jgi:hypothetical protein